MVTKSCLKVVQVGSILLLAGCGLGLKESSPTSTSTTTTSIDYGEGCNKTAVQTSRNLHNDFLSEVNKGGTEPNEDQVLEQIRLMKVYRSFIRSLDVPTLASKQSELVDAAEQFIIGLNAYLESGFADLSVNNAIVRLDDARFDFDSAFAEYCFYDR